MKPALFDPLFKALYGFFPRDVKGDDTRRLDILMLVSLEIDVFRSTETTGYFYLSGFDHEFRSTILAVENLFAGFFRD